MPHTRTTAMQEPAALDRKSVAVATAVAAIAVMAVMFYPYNQADDGGPRAILIVSGLVVAMTAVLFGPVATRATADTDRNPRSALILAVVAVLSAPFFWLGLPLVVGPAAAYLGHHARTSARTDRQRAQGTAAIVVGALVWALAALAALVG